MRGFQGVSVDDIVKKTRVTKGAFYHHFPRKVDLGYALVDEVIKPMIIERWITPLSAYKNPVQGILKQIKKHMGEEQKHFKYGCPLNNLIQEMAPLDTGMQIRLQAALDLWISETDKFIQIAQENGYLKRTLNSRDIAQFVVMAHEGFYGILKGAPKQASFKSLYKSLKLYFEHLSK